MKTRKVLKKEQISSMKLRNEAKTLPTYNKPLKTRFSFSLSSLRFLWCDGRGKPGKRAFFFSLARVVALGYVIICVIEPSIFRRELAIFIGVVLGETGLNYYKNERDYRSLKTEIDGI